MVKRKTAKICYISVPMFNLILTFQKELQEKENKKMKPKKITFKIASLQLSKRIKL